LASGGAQTTYISDRGNFAAATVMPIAKTAKSRFVLADIEVLAAKQVGAIVTLGDSITDGFRSNDDKNHRWPDYLSQCLNADGKSGMAVLNQGISGNRLPHDIAGPSSLARFDRDVRAQSGVTHVIVLDGINDIGLSGILWPVLPMVNKIAANKFFRQLLKGLQYIPRGIITDKLRTTQQPRQKSYLRWSIISNAG
jgi:lysophospholipase L1-like esterase